MKTNTTSQNETTLGWTSMPAYGEVMNTLVGTSHTSVTSTLKLHTKGAVTSFWTTLSSLK